MVEVVRFYRVADPYGCFSNFSPHPTFSDRRWPTTEHAFQAQKFLDPDAGATIAQTSSPMEAARLGRSDRWQLRADWDDVKNDVMLGLVRAKVAQHADVRELLLATGEAMIAEHTFNDAYWGDGGDGTGLNMLGRTLTTVRDEMHLGQRVVPVPPWIAFPGLGRASIGWSMGAGETYMMLWGRLYDQLGPADKRDYWERWPTPTSAEWNDYWATEG